MGRERVHVSGWGEGVQASPQPPRGAALGTLPDGAQRGPRQGLVQPQRTGGKTERGKDLSDATKLSVTGPESNLISVPSLSLIPSMDGKTSLGQEDQGRHTQGPPAPRRGLLTHQDLQLPILTGVRGVFTLIRPAHAHLALHHVLDLGAAGACWA